MKKMLKGTTSKLDKTKVVKYNLGKNCKHLYSPKNYYTKSMKHYLFKLNFEHIFPKEVRKYSTQLTEGKEITI